MLNSLLSNTSSNVSLSSILICTGVSVILGFMIAFTHMKTSKYSKNFLITLVVLPVLVQVIMMMVNGNLGTSVAIAGAFSLIRFRSIPGTSKEILSVFFAMTVGIITGMGYVVFGGIITVIVCFVIFIFHVIPLFNVDHKERILKVTVPENLDYTSMFNEIFDQYTKSATLEQVKTTNMGSLFDLSYRIVLNPGTNEKEFIDEIRIKNGNLKIILSHPMDGTDM
mgnify:CR=1 FL=1